MADYTYSGSPVSLGGPLREYLSGGDPMELPSGAAYDWQIGMKMLPVMQAAGQLDPAAALAWAEAVGYKPLAPDDPAVRDAVNIAGRGGQASGKPKYFSQREGDEPLIEMLNALMAGQRFSNPFVR